MYGAASFFQSSGSIVVSVLKQGKRATNPSYYQSLFLERERINFYYKKGDRSPVLGGDTFR